MKNNSFELKMISPDSSEEIIIEWIEIESPTGSFLVGHDHSPLVSIVKKKSIVCYKKMDGETISLDAPGGIFKIIDNKATILLDR